MLNKTKKSDGVNRQTQCVMFERIGGDDSPKELTIKFVTSWEAENKSRIGDEKLMTHSFVLKRLGKVMGDILTLVDSSIPNDRQNNAMKDTMRRIFSTEIGYLSDICFDQNVLMDFVNRTVNLDNIKEENGVSVEEILDVKKSDNK